MYISLSLRCFFLSFTCLFVDMAAIAQSAEQGGSHSFLNLKKKQANEDTHKDTVRQKPPLDSVGKKKKAPEKASKAQKLEHVYVPPPSIDATETNADPKGSTGKTVDITEQESDHLTGSWGGFRNTLSEKGLELELIYKIDAATVFAGGVEKNKKDYMQVGNLMLSMDFEKMFGWKGSSSFIYALWTKEAQLSSHVGDAQGTSNIEGAVSTTKLYEAWVQQTFFDEQVSLLVGLHDLNAEFYTTDSSAIFINSSFGIGKEMSQTGVNGPSVFPNTSPAIRLKAQPSPSFYLQTAAFNAQAANPNHPEGTHVRLSKNDGLLLISEFAYLRGGDEKSSERSAKYGFGFWSYTRTFDHQSATVGDGENEEPAQATNQGYYGLINQGLSNSVSVFLRYGYASPEVNRFSACSSAGLTLTGLIPRRDDDQIGMGVTRVDNGKVYKEAQEEAGEESDDAETTLEVTYRIKLWRGVVLQPDYQYVINPGTDPDLKNAEVGILRLEVPL